MLRVDQLYFRNFFILFFITLFVTALSGYFLLKKIEINNHKTMLTNMIEQFIVSQEPNIDEVVHRIKEKTGVRVTIIDADGVVRYESDRAVEGMKNHLNRPEVVEASQGKIGSSVRFSQSVGRDFLYVVKEDRGRFFRMAYALESIQEKFFKF